MDIYCQVPCYLAVAAMSSDALQVSGRRLQCYGGQVLDKTGTLLQVDMPRSALRNSSLKCTSVFQYVRLKLPACLKTLLTRLGCSAAPMCWPKLSTADLLERSCFGRWLKPLMDRLKVDTESTGLGAPNHVLANYYCAASSKHPAQGIMAHEDGPVYFPCACIISMGASAVMHFHKKLSGGTHAVQVDCKSRL